MSVFGTRVKRTEDPRLLTSGGVYVDDLRIPELTGAARLTFVRSPLAHALIIGIDTSAAKAHPGVVDVLTAADMVDLPPPVPKVQGTATRSGSFAEPLLAREKVRFVGEPVAVVITSGLYDGQDAADLVDVEYEQLPAVVGPAQAVASESLLFEEAGTNVASHSDRDTYDDAIFAQADVVIEQEILNQRLACLPLECRATAAVYDDARLTVWHSSQNAQRCRTALSDALGMAPETIRVIVPDVGGGFGAKIGIDRDPVIVAWAARTARTALRWAETRSENLLGMSQGRAQLHRVKLGGSRDGKITAYRLDVIQDTGAYPRSSSLTGLTCRMAPGVYDIPQVQAGFRIAVTNATPINSYRGSGRPEATSAIERAVDIFAGEIGMDPAEVRRRNFIAPDEFPFRTQTGVVYDSGEYEAVLDKVLEVAGYARLRTEQAARREREDVKALGIGISAYVEMTGGGWETAKVTVDAKGQVTVLTGSSAQGQGHHTAWAMLVQDELRIPMSEVTVIHGDTDLVPEGIGTYASRSLQLGGAAVRKAAIEVRDQARRYAADLLEADENDLLLNADTGTWQVAGDSDTALTWAQIADLTEADGLTADVRFTADPTFPFGVHVAVVEVDTETGKATLIRHIAGDDAGPILNPTIAEGQRHGGIAQGAAQALFEEVLYDEDGNPLTSTLADYAAISAPDLPSFELVASETPTKVNPLGVKGIGESGTIGSTPAIHNAVVNAVAHLGVRHIDMPTTPKRVWAAINEARRS